MSLSIITSQGIETIKKLGNTSQTKNLISALLAINSDNDNQPESTGWKKAKDAFENFGFTAVYDRNLVIITGALFAAISKSRCQVLKDDAQKVLDTAKPGTISSHKNLPLYLYTAIAIGDGGCLYNILNENKYFKNIMDNIGISDKCRKKYINRSKKLTPWKLKNSSATANAISHMLFQIRGKHVSGSPMSQEDTEVDIVESNNL